MFSNNVLILRCQPVEGVRGMQIFFFKSDPLMSYCLLSKGHKKTLAPERWQCDFSLKNKYILNKHSLITIYKHWVMLIGCPTELLATQV